MSTCDVCGKTFEASRSDQRFCGPACKQRNHRIIRNKNTPGDEGDVSEGPGAPDCGLSVTGAPARPPRQEKWPSWLDAPPDDAPVFVSVRGERLKLDFIASHGDPGNACRELLALDLHGRIGFLAATGTIGIVTKIDNAANLTMSEGTGRSIRFVKWKPFDRSIFEGDGNNDEDAE
ncbi:hypothetical protein [Rhizobium sp. RAF56]|uniref:hypothetical protein n=1 Tax=Rhizobium sp. RAF56 TaxID=3233062 RepID=UPI003F9C70BA